MIVGYGCFSVVLTLSPLLSVIIFDVRYPVQRGSKIGKTAKILVLIEDKLPRS